MFLERIMATKQKEVEQLKRTFSLAEAEKRIAALPPCRGFAKALTNHKNGSMGLIAEVKKASPSKGLIREDFDPAAIARSYEKAGANCISVLTDREYFQGSSDYLQWVREEVGVPLLRKDFTIDERQIYEARLIGADAVLLIAAILTREQIRDYLQTADAIGLDSLVEVHNAQELQTALSLNAALIGINNRNLHTFVTDLKVTEELVRSVPEGHVLISESGISSHEDVQFLLKQGIDAILVGEHLMRQTNIESAVHRLLQTGVS